MRELLPGLRVCFGYGPTEATLYTTAYNDPQPLERSCPIGRPLRGTRLYLLDDRMRPVPRGGPRRGLPRRSEPGPRLPEPARPHRRALRARPVRARRTGLPHRRPGALAAGRQRRVRRPRDDQLKLRGFRIEPGEVEAALLALPGVREAVGPGRPRRDRAAPPGRRRRRGDAGVTRTPYEWRAALGDRLPDYMIPAVFAEFPRLPLNRSGKLDRTAGAARRAGSPRPSRSTRPRPRDHVEMALYRIWRRVLLHPDIGISDDFFELGGTSLSAIKMAHAVQRGVRRRPLPVRRRHAAPHHRGARRAGARRRRRPRPRNPAASSSSARAAAGSAWSASIPPAAPRSATCRCPRAARRRRRGGAFRRPASTPASTTLPERRGDGRGVPAARRPPRRTRPWCCAASPTAGSSRTRWAAGWWRPGTRGSAWSCSTPTARTTRQQRAAIAPVDMAEFRDKLVRFNGMYPGIDDAQVDRYLPSTTTTARPPATTPYPPRRPVSC